MPTGIEPPAEFWRSQELSHLESRRSCQENTCYRLHTHDRFSIGLIDSGQSLFTGANGQTTSLFPGNVILIPAGHIHACNPVNGRWVYQMIHVDQRWISPLFPAQSSALLAGIHVFDAPDFYQDLCELNSQLFADVPVQRIQDSLRKIFTLQQNTKARFSCLPSLDSKLSARLQPVLDQLKTSPSTPALEDLASLVGLSKYQLIRVMKRVTGFTPVEWRHNEQVNEARSLLRAGHSVADTSSTLGFADQSHLHRIFRAHVAATPGAYRK